MRSVLRTEFKYLNCVNIIDRNSAIRWTSESKDQNFNLNRTVLNFFKIDKRKPFHQWS